MPISFFAQVHETTYSQRLGQYTAYCSCQWQSVPTDRLHYCLVLLEDHERHVRHERKTPISA